MAKKKAKGPKVGVKHQPGRGHDRKSAPQRKERFAKKQRRKRQAEDDDLRKRWEDWDKLSDDAKRLLPDLKPTEPRPADDAQNRPGEDTPR
jgi:hypothetical protein